MPEFFATPGTHAQKFDKVSGGVIPVIKIDTTTTAVPTTNAVMDSTGQPFNLDACTHVYARNILGRPLTDTATDGTSTWVKTYSYDASNNLVGKTGWVKQ